MMNMSTVKYVLSITITITAPRLLCTGIAPYVVLNTICFWHYSVLISKKIILQTK